MSAHDFNSLNTHVGHEINCVIYGTAEDVANVAIECIDCNEVLLDYDNINGEKGIPSENPYNLKDFRDALDEQIESVMDLDLDCDSDSEKLKRVRAHVIQELLNSDDFWDRVNNIIDNYDDVPEEDREIEQNFFEQGDFIPNEEKRGSLIPDAYLWDGDFRSERYKAMFERCDLPEDDPDRLYIYSLTEEDGEAYVSAGKRLANRIGYFFSTKYVELPETFRYW